jgi:transketolase
MNVNDLKIFAQRIRVGILECIASRGFGHVGGSLSIADVLAVLYGDIMNVSPEMKDDLNRDKLVCSKGHAGPAIYATLALKGFIPYEKLFTLNQPGTDLPSHCDKNKTSGVDMTTGSLGQGTSLAVGLALADKLQNRMAKTYVIVGDGEQDEGQVWEAASFTSAKKINNLIWIVDWNKKQLDGYTSDILEPFNIEEKFRAFGFDAVTINGHDIDVIHSELTKKIGDKPKAIILDSIKGYGIKEIEDTMSNHSMTVPKEKWDEWIKISKDKLASMGGNV